MNSIIYVFFWYFSDIVLLWTLSSWESDMILALLVDSLESQMRLCTSHLACMTTVPQILLILPKAPAVYMVSPIVFSLFNNWSFIIWPPIPPIPHEV